MNKLPADTFTVSQLNRLAKQTLEDVFQVVKVVGELSNVSRPGSGHWYFTLKDDKAQIRCAMFKNRNFAVKFQPEAGQKVMVTGRISLYEARGDYQLIADAMQPAGDGLLAIEFEKLKRELQAAGLFDADRKQPLPPRINHLAIVTSPTGAAVRDVVSVLARRWPLLEVSVVPAQVQGTAAAAQIVAALDWIEALQKSGERHFDAVLLTRGGGSLEDMWPFNERIVAEAIARATLPVVSAVGHEVDFSIADFVADLRAPTPSAAAELLSRDGAEVLARLQYLEQRLARAVGAVISNAQNRQHELRRRLRNPAERLREYAQRIDDLEVRLQRNITKRINDALATVVALRRALRHPGQRLQEQGQRLAELRRRLIRGMDQLLEAQRSERLVLSQQLLRVNPSTQIPVLLERVNDRQLRLLSAQRHQLNRLRERGTAVQQLLYNLNPAQTLQRGYAIVRDADGRIIRSVAALDLGDGLKISVADGVIDAEVTDTQHE